MFRLLLLVIAFHGHDPGPVNVVDRLEVNHKLCPQTGRELFVQVILWQWSTSYQRLEAVAYRVCHGNERLPYQTAGGIYEFQHHGATIRSQACIQTYTHWDPEQRSLRDLPQAYRSQVWPIVRSGQAARMPTSDALLDPRLELPAARDPP
jgi:hypothetical protein